MTCAVCGRAIERDEDAGQLLCSIDCQMVWNARKAFDMVNRAMTKGE